MATCVICKKSILFGGETVAGIRYCSKSCAKKGHALALTPAAVPEQMKIRAAGAVWIVAWATIAILASLVNFGIEMASWPKDNVPPNAISAALGYALSPFVLAGICLFSRQYRNLHSFFKVAGIIGIILLFVGIGKVSTSPTL